MLTLATRRANAQSEEDDRTKHECSNAFMKKRGAWASPNQLLVTRRPNAQEANEYTKDQCMEENKIEFSRRKEGGGRGLQSVNF